MTELEKNVGLNAVGEKVVLIQSVVHPNAPPHVFSAPRTTSHRFGIFVLFRVLKILEIARFHCFQDFIF